MAYVFINFGLLLFFSANFVNGIGVNWGSTTSHNLKPETAKQLLLDNGIDSVKLYEAHDIMITAFAKTDISVMVGIPNEELQKFSDNKKDEAKDWVKDKIEKHYNNDVNIKYVAVGNDPFSQRYNGMYLNSTFQAIKNIQKALDDAHLGKKIKATTPLNEDVYYSPTKPPSQSDFRKDIKDIVVEMVQWFDKNKSPFVVNINPFHDYLDLTYSPDFVLNYTRDAKKVIADKSTSYSNVFDVSIDKLAWSLKSAGVPDLKIVVGEIGWPTDGNINANNTLAEKFYAGFLKKLGNNNGTYLRPGPMEVYLSSLLDEDMRNIDQGNHERHWGIFNFAGEPKYPIDFSCQGRQNIMPVKAKNVEKLPLFYCIYNELTQTPKKMIEPTIDYVCKAADCTALTYGSSCNHLSLSGNISYMFNMYFQMYDQAEHSCNFNGLGTFSYVVQDNGTCKFPIQLKSAALLRVAFGTCELIVGFLAMVLLVLLSKGV